MSEPKDHHYLPQFYLEQWVGANERVTRYHRPYDKIEVSFRKPKYLGFEEELYTLHGAAEPQRIEKLFFSSVDNAAAPVLRHLITCGAKGLGNDQRVFWARFVMSLQLRGPHSLGEIRAVLDRNFRENIEHYGADYTAARQEGDPISVYEYLLQQTPDWVANAHKQLLPGLIDHEVVGERLINMTWDVLDLSESRHPLLTGDRPYYTSHGLLDPLCVLAVPLSPAHLFVAANHLVQLHRLRRETVTQLARKMNKLMVQLAVATIAP